MIIASKEIKGNTALTSRTSSCPLEEEIVQVLPEYILGRNRHHKCQNRLVLTIRLYLILGCNLSSLQIKRF